MGASGANRNKKGSNESTDFNIGLMVAGKHRISRMEKEERTGRHPFSPPEVLRFLERIDCEMLLGFAGKLLLHRRSRAGLELGALDRRVGLQGVIVGSPVDVDRAANLADVVRREGIEPVTEDIGPVAACSDHGGVEVRDFGDAPAGAGLDRDGFHGRFRSGDRDGTVRTGRAEVALTEDRGGIVGDERGGDEQPTADRRVFERTGGELQLLTGDDDLVRVMDGRLRDRNDLGHRE